MRKERSSGLASLLLLLLPFAGLPGCSNRPDSVQFNNAGSGAVTLTPAVSADTQAAAQHQVEQFVASVRKKDYAAVQRQMTPALRAKTPATLDAWLDAGRYRPMIDATGWTFDTNSSSGGKKLIVHTGFTGADKGSYRTNFVLSQSGKEWQVDTILPPTKQVPPKSQQGGMGAPPGH